jgi:2-phosphosulfolactate phosphatase
MYSEKGKYTVEVCFSPLSWPLYDRDDAVVVITDIFRASTAICAAFHNGVKSIIPVAEVRESEEYKRRGFIVAGERDGKKLDCADFGNSPFNFMEPALKGQTIVMNTTNGTQAIKAVAHGNNEVVIGAFINIGAVASYVMAQKKPVVIFCAGWKNRFSMEDTLYAGALVEQLLAASRGQYHSMCDAAIASADLWLLAKGNPMEYIEKAAHRHRLRKMGLDDIIEFSLTTDFTTVVPVLRGTELVDAFAQNANG